MKKTILKSFRYIECDDFASYLTEMSSKGWHFKEWKLGLVFEKGEPADISYAAEVFPKGSEMDVRTGPEAKEYAEYCAAAGWTLLDSRQKFCVFRRESPDAPPITTPEERLTNILRAQWKSWLSGSCSITLLCILYWTDFLVFHFSRWIFNNFLLFLLAVLTFLSLSELTQAFGLLVSTHRYKAELKAGNTPRYSAGRGGRALKRINVILHLLILGMLPAVAWQSGYRAGATIGIIVPITSILYVILVFWLRPSREGNWIAQIALGLTIPLFAAIITIICFSASDNEAVSFSDIPLPLSSEVFGHCSLQSFDFSQSIAGSLRHYSICVREGKTGGAASDTDNFWCWIYQSSHPEILDLIWKEETAKDMEQLQDCTLQWNAVYALSDNTWRYYLRYPDRVIVLWTILDLDEEQIGSLQQTLQKDDQWQENNFKH